MRRQTAFTLVELLVVIAILGMLVSIIVPVVTGAIGQANEVNCAGNLKSISQALANYGMAYKRFPGFECTIPWWNGIGYNNNDPATNVIADASRPMFMLMWVPDGTGGREEVDFVSARAFVCPGVSGAVKDPMAYTDQVGFTSHLNITYSYQHQTQVLTNANALTPRMPASRVILADKNPMLAYNGTSNSSGGTPWYQMTGTGQGKTSNSLSHGGGQNVLRVGGNVVFEKSSTINGDNIWVPESYSGTYPSADCQIAPDDAGDIVLLP